MIRSRGVLLHADVRLDRLEDRDRKGRTIVHEDIRAHALLNHPCIREPG